MASAGDYRIALSLEDAVGNEIYLSSADTSFDNDFTVASGSPNSEQNRAPIANDDVSHIVGNYRVLDTSTLLANDTDPDGDALVIASVGDAVGGDVLLIDGYPNFWVDAGFTGVARFTYRVSDGYSTSEAATVSINVSALPTYTPPVEIPTDPYTPPYTPPTPYTPPVITPTELIRLTVTGTAGDDAISSTNSVNGRKASNSHDEIYGRGGHDTIKAAGGSDILRGEAGNDKLHGDSGRDTLIGGTGKDSLSGGAQGDAFVFSTKLGTSNVDTITDFKHDIDVIQLDDKIFKTIGPTLDAGEFHAKVGATKAHDADDRIIYNKSSGKLYYDADGKGGAAAVHFATLSSKPTLDHGDFAIV